MHEGLDFRSLRSAMGHRLSPNELEEVATAVNCPSLFVSYRGIERHRFFADVTSRRIRHRASHWKAPERASDCTRDRRPERGPAEGCVRDFQIMSYGSVNVCPMANAVSLDTFIPAPARPMGSHLC